MQRSDVEDWRSDMSLFNIGFVIFPDLTQLDFTGPLQVLSRLPQSATHIIAKSEAPVPSDCGLGLVPTHTFANCPRLDLICVPGGSYGVDQAIGDRPSLRVGATCPRENVGDERSQDVMSDFHVRSPRFFALAMTWPRPSRSAGSRARHRP